MFASERADHQLFKTPKNFEIGSLLQILGEFEYENTYFFGDRCKKNGNDYPLFSNKSIRGFEVTGPRHTGNLLKNFI